MVRWWLDHSNRHSKSCGFHPTALLSFGDYWTIEHHANQGDRHEEVRIAVFGIETLSGTSYSAAIVGLVLVEAIVLYVVYGLVERVLAPHVRRAFER